jgi:hypothetical protein
MPDQEERRQDCIECIFHREHAARIATLDRDLTTAKGERVEMWVDIKKKVPYSHFLWAMGTILTIVLFTAGLNYKGMEEVLTSGKRVEVKVVEMNGKIQNINSLLEIRSAEHEDFRAAILEMQKQIFILTQRQIQILQHNNNGG